MTPAMAKPGVGADTTEAARAIDPDSISPIGAPVSSSSVIGWSLTWIVMPGRLLTIWMGTSASAGASTDSGTS